MTYSMKQQIFAPLAAGRGTVVDLEEDEAAEGHLEDDTEPEGPGDGQSVYMLPWEHPERFWREVLNCFGPSGRNGEKFCVVDFTPGSGTLATACARAQTRYLGFAHTPAQKTVIISNVKLAIVKDLSTNNNDGFLNKRRYLNREISLGGTPLPGGSSPKPKRDREREPKAPKSKKSKASKDASESSSSSSSES